LTAGKAAGDETVKDCDMANILTSKEVARVLKLSETTVCRRATKGELPAVKFGKSWRFDMDEIIRKMTRPSPRKKDCANVSTTPKRHP